MVDRLNPLDVSFLYLEESTTPMHVGGVEIFQPPEVGFDYDRLVALIQQRIALVPRYRQRVREVPGNLARPVWIDDTNFDVTYHVRRSALPRPGSDEQLDEFVGRIMSRPLDRSRPLWEMYLVEGLSDGRFAVVTKTHHAMVDGITAIDIGQVILDVTAEPRDVGPDTWQPRKSPSRFELVRSAVIEGAKSPAEAVSAVRTGIADLGKLAEQVGRQATGIASALLTVARPPNQTPLNVEIGEARRFGRVDMRLEDFKTIRTAHGGTVNDVVLAVVTGGLRAWLMTRGEALSQSATIRAMVPVSVRAEAVGGNQVAAILVDLPVGEPDPVVRLQRISYEMAQHKSQGQLMGAEALVAIAGFAPPTLHSLGARVGNELTKRVYNLVITNVPGPQFPLYAGGAEMTAAYPVVPLSKGQAVCIGLTSYNGGVYFGLNADRDSMPDLDVLCGCLSEAMSELLDTTPGGSRARRRPAAPRAAAGKSAEKAPASAKKAPKTAAGAKKAPAAATKVPAPAKRAPAPAKKTPKAAAAEG